MNQRLHCYQLLVHVAKDMPGFFSRMPKGEGYLIDQLKRAMISSILNLAEGNGRHSQRERNRFFDISLASISEVMGGIDTALAFGFCNISQSQGMLHDLRKAYNMIRKLKK